MPLGSLLATGCIISCGYFENLDGLLGIRTPEGVFRTQRLLYTDSGHYLLPIHHFNKPADEKLNAMIKTDYKQLQKDHDKSTHTHKHHDHRNKHSPTTTLTFPVALLTDDTHDDDTTTKDEKSTPSTSPPHFH